jgi:putative ABC transport system permease protein
VTVSFFALVLKNLFRQKVRTALTVLGISIGITTVVALGVVLDGMEASAEQILHAYGADFMVAQNGASDLAFSTVPEEEAAALEERDDVERAVPVLFSFSRVGGNPYFVTLGVPPEDLPGAGIALVEGRLLAPGATDEVMIGEGASSSLDAGVGDTVTIERTPLQVVGVFSSTSLWEDNGAYAPLATMQEILRKPDAVSAIFVSAASGYDPLEVADAIEQDNPTLTSVSTVDEYSEVDQGFEILNAVQLAISVLTVGIGAIGVMNTMVMSVFERTREIGILRAVGWRGSRILRMIMTESLLLCGIAAVVGSIMGIIASRLIMLIPLVANFLEPQYNLDVFMRALVVAVIVGLGGAAYPAMRAVRLTPMEALRHE